MRGIDLKVPDYPKSWLTDADYTFWEVLYDDGNVLREDLGAKYAQIERSRLKSFRLVQGGETIMEVFPPIGFTGKDLVYRRVTTIGVGTGRHTIFLIGWAHGPAVAVDPAAGSYRVGTFKYGDPDFDPPVPRPHEGEHFTLP